MSLLPKKSTSSLAQIHKYSASYVLTFVVGLLGYLLHGYLNQASLTTEVWKDRALKSEAKSSHQDSLIEQLYIRSTVQDETRRQLPYVADSILRNKK